MSWMCTESLGNKIMMRGSIVSERRNRDANLNLAHFNFWRDQFTARARIHGMLRVFWGLISDIAII